jgi:putative CocE/NonD family hydrolase
LEDFDPYLRGTLHLYKDMAAHSSLSQHLIVGPWAHLPWGRKVGAVDYGSQAASPVDELQVRWFDQFFKGTDTGVLEQPPVCLFEMGSNQWRYFDTFPSDNQKSYYLASSGLASTRDDASELVEACPQSCPEDVLVHDPRRPVPGLGGYASIPAGSFNRSHLDCRTDVLTYTSTPLAKDLHLAGDVVVEVYCTADKPSFDLCAVLSEVRPDGSAYNFTQGYVRVNSGESPVQLSLQATCVQIAQADCLRLSLSAACFLAYPVNPGTGALPRETRIYEAQVITLTVSCGGMRSSQVGLPVV